MIRRQTICRVIYRDAKGRFVRPPEKPARVELEPLPKGEKGRFRVHKGGEVVAVEEMPRGRGVRVRFVPDASIRKAMLEARARGDKATLRQIREWEREVKRLAAEDYLKAKRSKEWAKRMERAKQKSDASKGGEKGGCQPPKGPGPRGTDAWGKHICAHGPLPARGRGRPGEEGYSRGA